MWSRFTEHLRRVTFYAQQAAHGLGKSTVDTEHFLIGLTRESDHAAAQVLGILGIEVQSIYAAVECRVVQGQGGSGQDMELAPCGKRVIDLAYEEARRLNESHLGTEHLLIGLIREEGGLAAQILTDLGAEVELTRSVVRTIQDRRQIEPPAEGKARKLFRRIRSALSHSSSA